MFSTPPTTVVRSLTPVDRSWWAFPVGTAVALSTVVFAPLAPPQAWILAITLFSICLWVATPIPPWVTGVLGVGLVGVAFSPTLAFGGFGEPVLWLVVFGLIVGEAIHRGDVATVVETRVVRWVATGDGTDDVNALCLYRRLLVSLSVGALAFALVVPSSLVRVLILTPILVDLGQGFDSTDAQLGLLFGPLFATFYGGVGVLTAFLPNVVIAGIVESTTGNPISWSEWFVTLFPVVGLGRVALVIGVVYLLYRPDPTTDVNLDVTASGGDATAARRTALFLLVGVGIWATDFLHGLHPVFGALVVAILCCLPVIGTVSFDVVGDVDFSIVFFVGAVFAISKTLTETGLTEVAATSLLSVVPADAPLPVVLVSVFGVTLAMVFLMEGVATASVLTPILISFADGAGVPVMPVVQAEAIALGTLFFPYQSVVLVALLDYDSISTPTLVRVASILSLATILVLVPLQVLVVART